MYLFVDTNVLLHGKDFNSIDWSKLVDTKNIVIMISRPVQEEIDKLKNLGNSRRSRRAKKWSSLFRKLVDVSDNNETICSGTIDVEVRLSPRVNYSNISDYDLDDISRPDNKIIFEALEFRKTNLPTTDVRLLTNDSNPMLTARFLGLDYVEFKDEFLEPPESDDRDKKIKDLQNNLQQMSSNLPVIQLIVEKPKEEDTSIFSQFETFGEKHITTLSRYLTKRHPRYVFPTKEKKPGTLSIMDAFQDRIQDKIELYHKEYDAFESSIECFCKELHSFVNLNLRMLSLRVRVTNTGSVPCRNILLQIELGKGLVIVPPENSVAYSKVGFEEPTLPIPPDDPDITSIVGLHNSSWYTNQLDMIRHFDKNVVPKFARFLAGCFEWTNDCDGFQQKASFSCDNLMHQMDDIFLDLKLLIMEKDISDSYVKCTLAADNLRKPVEIVSKIKFKFDGFQELDFVDLGKLLYGDGF